jgi:hypothetical protein
MRVMTMAPTTGIETLYRRSSLPRVAAVSESGPSVRRRAQRRTMVRAPRARVNATASASHPGNACTASNSRERAESR